ncbi:MAG: hypothetical protein NC397_03580 [Clostridium sp.]|nr:hypothetical protein [Clostridium sp.]
MNNKKIAVIITIFIVTAFIIIGLLAAAEHIPLFGKPLAFIFAIVLVIFVLAFFILAAKRKR